MIYSKQAEEAWIDRPDSLERFLKAVADAPWLVLDTEFMRVRSYYPQLCVIQLTDGEHFGLIDACANLDLQALVTCLREPRPIALHACLQDVEALHHDFDLIPSEVFDTQIAWSLLGQGFQIGFSSAVEQKFGVTLDKSLVRSRWDRRPLSNAQLQYALSDVLHLTPLYESLRDELEARGRTAWMHEEMQRILVPQTWTVEPSDAWKRVRGAQRLDGKQKGCLRELAAWREWTARKRDLARVFVISDDVLLALAKEPDMKRKEFDQLVSRKLQRKLWQTLQQARNAPPTPASPHQNQKQRREMGQQLQALAEIVRIVAADLKINPELLANRTMLEELLTKQPQATVLKGWRRNCVGNTLLGTLNGL